MFLLVKTEGAMSDSKARSASKRGPPGDRRKLVKGSAGSKGAAGPNMDHKPSERPARQEGPGPRGEKLEEGEGAEERGGGVRTSRWRTPWPSERPGSQDEGSRPDQGPGSGGTAKKRDREIPGEQVSRRGSGKDPGGEGSRPGLGSKGSKKEQQLAEASGPSTAWEGEMPTSQDLHPTLESAFSQ
eukprot:g17582.t1